MIRASFPPASPVAPRRLAFLAVVLAVTACGCGGTNVPVKGKASVGDKPLSAGSVRFLPDKEKGNNTAGEPYGVISEGGTYDVKTNGKPGAPPGWYKVVVTAVTPVDLNNPSPPPSKSLIAAKYNQPETTDLHLEVKENAGDGAYDLKLSGPAPGDSNQGGVVPVMPGTTPR